MESRINTVKLILPGVKENKEVLADAVGGVSVRNLGWIRVRLSESFALIMRLCGGFRIAHCQPIGATGVAALMPGVL